MTMGGECVCVRVCISYKTDDVPKKVSQALLVCTVGERVTANHSERVNRRQVEKEVKEAEVSGSEDKSKTTVEKERERVEEDKLVSFLTSKSSSSGSAEGVGGSCEGVAQERERKRGLYGQLQKEREEVRDRS